MTSIPHLFETFISNYNLFFKGLWLTIQLTVFSVIIALIVGLIIALLKLTDVKLLKWISDIYIWIVRGTPLVVQIFILFYGLTAIIRLDAFTAGVIAIAFHNGGYMAEIFRGAIESIDVGQTEAGRSLGMNKRLTMRRIILPQAVRRSIPMFGNQFIIALKDTSLVSFIGLQELFGIANTAGSNNYDFLTYYIIVAVYYLFVVVILTMIFNKIEKKLSESD